MSYFRERTSTAAINYVEIIITCVPEGLHVFPDVTCYTSAVYIKSAVEFTVFLPRRSVDSSDADGNIFSSPPSTRARRGWLHEPLPDYFPLSFCRFAAKDV